MRHVKVLIFLLFLTVFFTGLGQRFVSTTVSGQGGTLSAPTNVTVSDGAYSKKIGIFWDTIRGATTYRIFRNTVNNSAAATDIGTTVAPYFFDITAVVGQNYFYWVKAENGSLVSTFSEPDQGFRAAGPDIGMIDPLLPPPAPAANPLTATKAYLGKTLFWDEQLSSTRTVACGTCHTASKGGVDKRSFFQQTRATNPGPDNLFGTNDDIIGSPGVPANNANGSYNFSSLFGFREQVTGRKSISYINAGYSEDLFWDGRALSTFRDPLTNAVVIPLGGALESQSMGPPLSSAEMAHGGRNWTEAANRIAVSTPLALAPSVPVPLAKWINGRSYPELFQEAFGTPEVTPVRIALAIATFERTTFSDQILLDNTGAQLTPEEARGSVVFNTASCGQCHAGTLFSDDLYHNIGVRPQSDDTGRFQVTQDPFDRGQFRNPGLRNIELRAPYMHNGRFQTLEDVVEFYNRGGDFDAPNIDRTLIRQLNLTNQEKADLVAFLKRPLTDRRVADETGPFTRPALYSESARVPQIVGNGVAGSGNLTPQPTAIEPPMIGNPAFTVAVSNAVGGANAVLVIDNNDPGTGPTIPANGSLARVTVPLSGTGAGQGRGSATIAIPNNPALVGSTFFGRWFIPDTNAPGGVAVTRAFKFVVFAPSSYAPRTRQADFDGDGKTDISVYRPNSGTWFISNSSNGAATVITLGNSTDKIVPADYDGDGKTDLAIYRSGSWQIQRSQAGNVTIQFGIAEDKPQPGDYDGDGKADLAVWRPSTGIWYIQRSRDGFLGVQLGANGDRPVAGDYDGDGKYDPAVYRNGIWYLLGSTYGLSALQFGLTDDKPVIGDYDGDNRTDLAVYRPSTGYWYYLRSSINTVGLVKFGVDTDLPAPGDFDGDGKSDFAVFRPTEGNWYVMNNSNNAFNGRKWGISGDTPVSSFVVP